MAMLTDTPWESQRHKGVGAVWQLWASPAFLGLWLPSALVCAHLAAFLPPQGLLATWPCTAGAPGRPSQASRHLCPL